MAYTLTLTHGERQAIDWIGERYSHGVELSLLLWSDSKVMDDHAEWDDDCDMVFTVPESVAWEIARIVEEGLDCFSPTLVRKLREFADKIV